jgi:hypothetical protein
MRATRSVPKEIVWARSEHSSKSRATEDAGTLSRIVTITIAVAATIVAGSLSAGRLAVNMPEYVRGHAALANTLRNFPSSCVAHQSQQAFLFVRGLRLLGAGIGRRAVVLVIEHEEPLQEIVHDALKEGSFAVIAAPPASCHVRARIDRPGPLHGIRARSFLQTDRC